jgi:anion-transporting  ArsA/GET3 family ATPase
MSAQIVICCGSGGVGKTTTSAALALKWAMSGSSVCVLTIDPARRLADSLDIGQLGAEATPIPLPGAQGRCDALMLNVPDTFEGLIHQFADSPETAHRILDNRYFQFASNRLGGVHEFMAAERVRQLAAGGHYDVVVVDTPPTRNALDFLNAPERMAGLMDGAVMRWMSMPATRGGWRALELGSEAVTRVLRLLVGQSTIGEIAQFFDLFRDLWDGFRARSLDMQRMLRDESTRFVLISSPEPTARGEALFFLNQLKAQGMPFGGFIVNRVEMATTRGIQPSDFPPDGPGDWGSTVGQLVAICGVQARLAEIHERSIQALISAGPDGTKHWTIPHQGHPIHKLQDLLSIGSHLPDLDGLC